MAPGENRPYESDSEESQSDSNKPKKPKKDTTLTMPTIGSFETSVLSIFKLCEYLV